MSNDEFSSAAGAATSMLIYGAGSAGRKCLRTLRAEGVDVPFALDVNAERIRQIDGTSVRSPLDPSLEQRSRSLPVVISIFNRDVDTVEVARFLEKSGFRSLISFPEFHKARWRELGEDFWMGDPALLERESENIVRAASLWADEKSRRVFRSLIDLYRSRRPVEGPVPDPREQEYLPGDVQQWLPKGVLRLIDGGAFDGDTLEHFRQSSLPIEGAACFEPDPENFLRLRDRIRGWPAADRRGVFLWPCGLAEQTGMRRFSAGGGEASHLSGGDSGIPVSCVALDDVVPGFDPNLLKLDVEGAEETALIGSTELIHRHRPRLAISVYHRPADLWRLPALVADWDLGYSIYLRSYGFNGFDTVCYAVP